MYKLDILEDQVICIYNTRNITTADYMYKLEVLEHQNIGIYQKY